MIKIIVNGEEMQIPATTNISTLLLQLGVGESKGVALAINEEVVPKSLWKVRVFFPEDRIVIIKPTAGG